MPELANFRPKTVISHNMYRKLSNEQNEKKNQFCKKNRQDITMTFY